MDAVNSATCVMSCFEADRNSAVCEPKNRYGRMAERVADMASTDLRAVGKSCGVLRMQGSVDRSSKGSEGAGSVLRRVGGGGEDGMGVNGNDGQLRCGRGGK